MNEIKKENKNRQKNIFFDTFIRKTEIAQTESQCHNI